MPRLSRAASEIEVLSEIRDALANLLSVVALTYTSGKSQQVAIESFAAAGLAAKTVSDMTGWPSTTVAPIVSRSKAKAKAKAPSSSKEASGGKG